MRFAKHLFVLGLVLGAAGLSAASCSIPKPECTVGQSGFLGGLSGNDYLAFATRYVVKDNSAGCPVLTGEMVGFQTYHPATGDGSTRDFSKTSVAVRPQNLGELTWLTEDLGLAGDTVTPNGLGDFGATDPDASDMCQVQSFSSAQVIWPGFVFPSDPSFYATADTTACTDASDCYQDAEGDFEAVCTDGFCELPAVCNDDAECADLPGSVCRADLDGACYVPPECMMDDECSATVPEATCYGADPGTMTPGFCAVAVDLPATDLKYDFTDIQFYVTAGAPGTQFTANVKVTLNGCEATYTAVGMWPAVDCSEFETYVATTCTSDADCAGTGTPTCNPMDGPCEYCDTEAGSCVIRVTGTDLCNPEADPERGRAVGSGINPDFGPTKCDTTMLVTPVIDTWYSLPDIAGAPLSVPRCALDVDAIPALSPNFAPVDTE